MFCVLTLNKTETEREIARERMRERERERERERSTMWAQSFNPLAPKWGSQLSTVSTPFRLLKLNSNSKRNITIKW